MSAPSEHEKNPDYVVRGLKAAIHNLNVSSEAKDHAAQQLEEMGVNSSGSDAPQKPSVQEYLRHVLHHNEHDKNPDYVARGLKAAIHNPNVSSEAKDHAAQQLEEMGVKSSDSDAPQKPSVQECFLRRVLHHKTDEPDKNPDYVARGLKAAIHNPNVSSEAKDDVAQLEQLEEMGVKTGDSDAQKLSDEEPLRRKLAGYKSYKATLSNPNTSAEAKKHAQSVLGSFMNDEAKNENRIMGGYKATLKNPHASEEAKQQAERVLKKHDAL